MAAGKHTLAVMIGRPRARALYALTLLLAFAAIAIGAAFGALPAWSAISLTVAPLAIPLVRTIGAETSGPALTNVLVGTARLQLITAALLAVGILLP